MTPERDLKETARAERRAAEGQFARDARTALRALPNYAIGVCPKCGGQIPFSKEDEEGHVICPKDQTPYEMILCIPFLEAIDKIEERN